MSAIQRHEIVPKDQGEAAATAPPPSPEPSENPVGKFIKLALSGASVGFLFGFSFDKAKVLVPRAITDAFLFKNAIMFKMFLSATAVGLVIIALLETFGIRHRTHRGPRSLGFGLMHGYGLNIVGGMLLGCGMVLCGSCPGTVFAQLGAGVPSAPWTLLGGYIGVLLFAVVHRLLTDALPQFERFGEKKALDGMFGWSYLKTASMVSLMLAVVVLILELTVPFKEDLLRVLTPRPDSYVMWGFDPTALAWSPVAAGILIGLIQLLAMVTNKTPLGASYGYVTVVSWVVSPIPNIEERLPAFKGARGSFWQIFVACGSMLGAFVSSTAGDFHTDMLPASPSIALAISGGALQLFGARLAGGCTSGHGISGMAQLSLPSIITSCCMITGALITAWLAFGFW